MVLPSVGSKRTRQPDQCSSQKDTTRGNDGNIQNLCIHDCNRKIKLPALTASTLRTQQATPGLKDTTIPHSGSTPSIWNDTYHLPLPCPHRVVVHFVKPSSGMFHVAKRVHYPKGQGSTPGHPPAFLQDQQNGSQSSDAPGGCVCVGSAGCENRRTGGGSGCSSRVYGTCVRGA